MRGNQVRILYDYFDLSVTTSEFELQSSVTEYESAVLTDTGMSYAPGTTELILTMNGYFDGVDGGSEEVLNVALEDGDRHVGLVLDYSNLPASFYVIENAFNVDLTWSAPFDGLMTVNGSLKGRVGGHRGRLVYYNETSAATGAEASRQVSGLLNGDTGKAYMFLHGWTGTRSGNIVIEIQSSPDNSTWTTIATFTLTEARSQVASVTYTGAYVRANVSSMGGTTQLNYSVGVVEN